MKVSKDTLRRLIKEAMADDSNSGLPRPNDLARKLSNAGPEAALRFLSDLMMLLNFGGSAPKQEPAPAPEPMPEDL